jgi:hypothetical protein
VGGCHWKTRVLPVYKDVHSDGCGCSKRVKTKYTHPSHKLEPNLGMKVVRKLAENKVSAGQGVREGGREAGSRAHMTMWRRSASRSRHPLPALCRIVTVGGREREMEMETVPAQSNTHPAT